MLVRMRVMEGHSLRPSVSLPSRTVPSFWIPTSPRVGKTQKWSATARQPRQKASTNEFTAAAAGTYITITPPALLISRVSLPLSCYLSHLLDVEASVRFGRG